MHQQSDELGSVAVLLPEEPEQQLAVMVAIAAIALPCHRLAGAFVVVAELQPEVVEQESLSLEEAQALTEQETWTAGGPTHHRQSQSTVVV